MSHLTQDLAALLHQVRRPGSFYVSGSVDIHTPRVEVEGVGTLALPLLPVQAVQILEHIASMAYKNAKNTFTLPGIGKLVLVNRKARIGRNPATGEQINIPAKRVVKFRVAKAAKDAILGVK